ncbi:MAG TPA: FadR/GntR family transcriptional regulator [Pseudolabrys sp.]|nr:FadR/GntR family transcriptional regulator [Pseudolabrys sp.]
MSSDIGKNDKLASSAPLSAPRSLTRELIERISADIAGGKLAPGERLPTEQEMIAATGVSRTVVREAVAALRAEGLVTTRQGVGAFVSANARRPFRIEFEKLSTLKEVVQVVELRTGLEIEAAGLAAERASTAELRKISVAYDAIDAAVRRGETAIDEDFAFHCSIAAATANPQYLRFLQYLGRFIIPRQTVQIADRRAYLAKIQAEHRDIVAAIKARAVTQARAAMRRHLLNSLKRYKRLAAQLGES